MAVYQGPSLSAEQWRLDAITSRTYEVLERVGVRFASEEALDILRGAGARVEGDVVKIPEFLVKRAISTAPSRVTLYSRDGRNALALCGGNQYYGTGSDCPYHLDSTGTRRQTLLDDVTRVTRLSDALRNVDFVMSMGLASDVPEALADRLQFKAMVENTSKPMLFTAFSLDGLVDIHRLAAVVSGGSQAFAEKPFACIYLMPSPPLRHSREAVEKLMYCARHFIPAVYATAPLAGATGPITEAGRLIVGNAELLSGLVLHQLVQPGAPYIYGVGFGVLDLKTGVNCYCAPEHLHANCTGTQLARGYGLPVFGYAGFSDSKLLDKQAGLEIGITTVMGALSGANLLHDVGYLESGMTSSIETVVLADEVIGFVKAMFKGVEVSDEEFAVDVIARVGPGGSFLRDRHTRAHLRDIWYPELIDRRGYADWRTDGGSTLGQRVAAKAARIVGEHSPAPLDSGVQHEIECMAEGWGRKA